MTLFCTWCSLSMFSLSVYLYHTSKHHTSIFCVSIDIFRSLQMILIWHQVHREKFRSFSPIAADIAKCDVRIWILTLCYFNRVTHLLIHTHAFIHLDADNPIEKSIHNMYMIATVWILNTSIQCLWIYDDVQTTWIYLKKFKSCEIFPPIAMFSRFRFKIGLANFSIPTARNIQIINIYWLSIQN